MIVNRVCYTLVGGNFVEGGRFDVEKECPNRKFPTDTMHKHVVANECQ